MTTQDTNGSNGAANGSEYYVRLDTPAACRKFAEESVRAMLGESVSVEEAWARQDQGQFEGTIIDYELNSLRAMLGHDAA